MKWKRKVGSSAKRIVTYLKDYRFSSILIRYFLLLFICLVLPVTVLSVWYGNQMRKNLEEEIIKRNEASLEQVHDNVNSIILSAKNLAYSLSVSEEVRYLCVRTDVKTETSGDLEKLYSMLGVFRNASDYLDSVCVYLQKSDTFISNHGVLAYDEYEDSECLEMYSEEMPGRTVFWSRKKNDKYPYLLTVLYPISVSKDGNLGAVVVNIDVEKLGEYIGSGQYRNKDYSPMLLIYDAGMENLIYSDEYRLLNEEEEFELGISADWADNFSDICELDGKNYILSAKRSEETDFRYIYLTSMRAFESQSRTTGQHLRSIIILLAAVCLVLAWVLAKWVYKPIQQTIRVLKDMSMLTEWDRKEHVDEIESIQRSILTAKKEKDNLNEQIQERIISLHNAQICALQTQINPHFLYNTLESIGNAAALLYGENKVTEMIYSLGLMMRISLAGENYLVPLAEELKHVELYVKLVDFRFRDRIRMHMEIPEEMKQIKIVKLTLQPLIENAIQHGLARKRSNGEVWVKGEMAGDQNYIHVIDNGEGISEEALHGLQEQLKENAINSGRHIGLRNVDQRLKLVFGEEYGLSIRRVEEGGLCVTICYKTV